MARGRFLNASVAVDIALNSLSLEAHWLYMMTIPHLDRDGLIIADTYVFFGKVCPRRPELIPRIDALMSEWAAAGLVTLYPTHDGKVAFFHGFARNQQGMNYSREGVSVLQPPPGYIRTNTGLSQTNGDDDDLVNSESEKQTPEQLLTNSGLTPAEVKDQYEVKDQVEGKAGGAAAPHAAALNRDLARVWEAWDANMPGAKTPVIVDSVNALLEDYSPAEIIEAISIAVKKNKRHLSYVQGILSKGAFNEAPKPSGGDYRPSNAASNRQAVANVFAKLRAQEVNGHG